MNKDFKLPPQSPALLTEPTLLVQRLSQLVGNPFPLTGKTRTDGSNNRKLIASVLENYTLPLKAESEGFEIVPPKRKGVPKITREFIDTYMVTSGSSYNLQVWNRMPASETLLIKYITYITGESLKCTDVRFVFSRIDIKTNTIASIIILTPKYIEAKFGKFGKPTIKHQLLISQLERNKIYQSVDKIFLFPDTDKINSQINSDFDSPNQPMVEEPKLDELYSMDVLKKKVAEKLIGQKLVSAATKNRGQALERKVLDLLGYKTKKSNLLYDGYPDIKNQLLEVKVQDSPTVDLGKFTPESEEIVFESLNLTTFDVRYLIALTDPTTEVIEGIILSPGKNLGELFSYVSNKSYKCQRSIPMSFFGQFEGKAVFNPDF